MDALDAAVELLQTADLDAAPADELLVARRLEATRRRLDHGTDRVAGHLDACAAFSLDGHRNARCALKHLGRLPGAEALGRVTTARALRGLPTVEDAYARGQIPTGHVRAIARAVSNPRVSDFVAVADPVFAEMASTLGYDEFCSWLRQWESLADADGAAEATEAAHERRRFSLLENEIDGSFTAAGLHGALQGAAMSELLDVFERAEFEADWAEARAIHGADTRVEHLARTPAQRRADAAFEIFRRAGAVAPDARSPEPLVNIVVDQDTLDDEIRRSAGAPVDTDPDASEGRRCHTIGGATLHPSDALAAAIVGHVRRVVVDAAGTVVDVGRRRRLFTGSSRDAALLQALLRGPGGLRCLWPGCDARGGCLQIDHRQPAARGGPTDIANSDVHCGSHNRIKERGFRPVRDPDGTWTIFRPDGGGPITPAI
ncbi:HNH endonuclease signature motif containing protein [Actinospongicola halichondriae]|uniref:HNH endonuclease signature motif containing protein n=1 Tax=Actinospongicola halichondriae TaxID=3236844 RepID=UPI003D38C331